MASRSFAAQSIDGDAWHKSIGGDAWHKCADCQTRKVCLASRLPQRDHRWLAGWLGDRCVEPQAYLYRAGDTADQQFHVRSGMFKTFVVNASGDEFITGFHIPGDILGLVHRNGCYVESAVALDAASVCTLQPDALTGEAANKIAAHLVNHLADHAANDLDHRFVLGNNSAQARFCAFCLGYKERLDQLGRDPNFLPMPMSRTDLANYLGMSLESLSRVVSKLNSSGVIAAARRHLVIQQPETLSTLAIHAVR